MNECHAPTASELARSAEAVAAHLPKLKTADEILLEIEKLVEGLSLSEAGQNLFRLIETISACIVLIQNNHPADADRFARYLNNRLNTCNTKYNYNMEQEND